MFRATDIKLKVAVGAALAVGLAIFAIASSGRVTTGTGSPRTADVENVAGSRVGRQYVRFDSQGQGSRVSAFATVLGMDLARATSVGSFRDAGTAEEADVFRVPTRDGEECLLVVDSMIGSSCLDGGLFELRDIAFLVTFEAGRGPDDLRRQRVTGVVSDAVVRLDVTYKDGTNRRIALLPTGGFRHVVPPGKLASGVRLDALVAFDASGAVVERLAIDG